MCSGCSRFGYTLGPGEIGLWVLSAVDPATTDHVARGTTKRRPLPGIPTSSPPHSTASVVVFNHSDRARVSMASGAMGPGVAPHPVNCYRIPSLLQAGPVLLAFAELRNTPQPPNARPQDGGDCLVYAPAPVTAPVLPNTAKPHEYLAVKRSTDGCPSPALRPHRRISTPSHPLPCCGAQRPILAAAAHRVRDGAGLQHGLRLSHANSHRSLPQQPPADLQQHVLLADREPRPRHQLGGAAKHL